MIGTIGYATEQGLGIQTKAFIDNGIIDKIFIIPHSSYPNHYEWYSEDQKVQSIEELYKCDTLIFFETLWNYWQLIPTCRELGIKTILMVHYECTRYPLPYFPDVIISPSDIDFKYHGGVRLNVPVDVPWKLRKKARVFVHNSGHGGLNGRNGTKELLEAMQYVKSPIKLIVRTQNGNYTSNDPRVEIIHGSVPYEELFDKGDVFILPEKFGGSFLPMQEAFASGMPVMASDRFPTNEWLPKELLIPVKDYKKERIYCEFDSALVDPKDIAAKIDEIYGKDISAYSKKGQEWAKENSWKKLKPKYLSL